MKGVPRSSLLGRGSVIPADSQRLATQSVSPPPPLQRVFKDESGGGKFELGQATVTTEGDEVQIACLLVPAEVRGHGRSFLPASGEVFVMGETTLPPKRSLSGAPR
jgi:hypothetical protein